jgi:hypothetical protein
MGGQTASPGQTSEASTSVPEEGAQPTWEPPEAHADLSELDSADVESRMDEPERSDLDSSPNAPSEPGGSEPEPQ